MRIQALGGAVLVLISLIFAQVAAAAPYAAFVMDARTGKVLHSRNADTRLHPASLTKMMTLYVAFKAIESGQLSLDKKVKVSANAASEPPSRLGLKQGMRISIRHLVRATAVKSANDAATALGEAISGSEAAFTKQMTAQAKALGMNRTTFKNAHGLTQSGHMSTARDMSILGRRLLFDFPEYYNLFSRRTTDAGLREVPNTNRRLLANYRGADGIKTGYTNAAGFNLVASAERGDKRIIATVFGGRTSASRNARVAELLDMGFGRTPARYAKGTAPSTPTKAMRVAAVDPAPEAVIIKAPRAAAISPRPRRRPVFSEEALMIASIARDVKEAQILAALEQNALVKEDQLEDITLTSASISAQTEQEIINSIATFTAEQQEEQYATGYMEPITEEERIVRRVEIAQKGNWKIELGNYPTEYKAHKVLLSTVLADLSALEGALRKISPTKVDGGTRYKAQFTGMGKKAAERACARIVVRGTPCDPIGPDV